MAQRYTIQLTQGNSEGNYSVYYNIISDSTYATATTNNQLTRDITYNTLSSPNFVVAIPDSATKIIILGLGSCNNVFEYPVTPVGPPNNSPVLCFSWGKGVSINKITFNPNGISPTTGRPSWTSTNNNYFLNWDVENNQWKIIINSNLSFISTYTSHDLVPDGSWTAVGSQSLGYTGNMVRGVCLPTTSSLAVVLTQIPNTCFVNPTKPQNCDGVITITASGGVPPYQYSIDGTNFQVSPVFNNLCPNTYSIKTKDSQGTSSINTIIVGNGSQSTTYNILLTNIGSLLQDTPLVKQKKSTWYLDFPNNLSVGTFFDLMLKFTITEVVGQPGNGEIIETLQVLQNNVAVELYNQTSSTFTRQRADCNYTETVTQTIKSFFIEYSVGDIIKGTYNSSLNITTPSTTNNCATSLTNTVDINLTIDGSNCQCCEVNSFGETTLLSNNITATNITNLIPVCLNYGPTCYNATHSNGGEI